MRRLSIAALMAVPLLFLTTASKTAANPTPYRGFGSGDFGLNLFKGIHQHGPLFNYGPYYGYYPFKPYGPWDEYLRYDPFFYGDPYRNWVPPDQRQGTDDPNSNRYGWNQNLENRPRLGFGRVGFARPDFHRIGLPHLGLPHWDLFHKFGFSTGGFWHASWLHGGWYRGHVWLHGRSFGLFNKSCSSCGAVAVVAPALPTGDVLPRFSGVGSPDQSATFYSETPTLNPVLDLGPVAEPTK